MCGINGLISSELAAEQREEIIKRMNECLSHRGPDHDGIFSEHAITLGHRRLSIIDLSAEGNQPFFSVDKRYAIVYNGELYNYRDLRLELQRSKMGTAEQPYFFSTSSDTEVVLAAYIRWGLGCLERFNGMYAFAIYDRETKRIVAARDRLGVKPFYYSYSDQGFIFSSEVRPILRSGVRKFTINKSAIGEYAMYQTVHAPATIIKEIKMLLPGHYLEVEEGKAVITKYYDINLIAPRRKEEDYEQCCRRVSDLLGASVQKRLVADVPFGAFLSGGIDSSVVVGLMSQVSSEKVRTFNVSFNEEEFSESKYARLIAKRFNTEHHEIKLLPQDFLKGLPEALEAMDHPGGDGPNTYIVSKATKERGIKMALSGIGGDELFAGYDVFRRMSQLQKKTWINRIPRHGRVAAGLLLKLKKKTAATEKIAELLAQDEIRLETAYPLVRSVFTQKELERLTTAADPLKRVREIVSAVPQNENHLLSSVSMAEIGSYLQNVLLRDADQMGMAVALEIREPFLDYQLAEYVLSLSDDLKFPHTPKKLLVDSMKDLLPDEIINRPKMGFTLPWTHWMKNELRDFCESNLSELCSRQLFHEKGISLLWQRFLAGDQRAGWSRIWHLVILNHWISSNSDYLGD